MIEHRLIERMIRLLQRQGEIAGESRALNAVFIDQAVDFFRTYADRTHHGKEEDILFKELEERELPEGLDQTMQSLIDQHKYARRAVTGLWEANQAYLNGDREVLEDIQEMLDDLSAFYLRHIQLEDKHFFIPCMGYFSQSEQDEMLREFYEFDRNMIHEKYRKLIESYESPAAI
jgi:hemerythrin-like domain-containing protein